jgi:hypothetical protein
MLVIELVLRYIYMYIYIDITNQLTSDIFGVITDVLSSHLVHLINTCMYTVLLIFCGFNNWRSRN